MPHVHIILDGDGCWPELAGLDLKEMEAELRGVAYLSKGMVGGLPSITMKIECKDGRVVLAQTSLRLFLAAAAAFKAKAEMEGLEL